MKNQRSLFLIILSAFTFNLSAQYKLSGKIFDESGEPLIGATVIIKETSQGTVTDIDGTFDIKNIAVKNVQIDVSFLGYHPVNKALNLSKTKTIRITLLPTSENLSEVTVSAESKGQTKALIDQQRAENIKNIVSAEQIENFPDMNAAEALQRVTGITLQRDQGEGKYVQLRGTPPEMTNFNINGEQIPSPEGDVRYVGMDIISADQIETIEVTKVLTPDMDGDGIAGAVNIVTKKATSETPDIKAGISSGYNHLRGTPNYNIQFSYGARKKKLGFQVNGSYYQNEQGSDNLSASFIKGPFWGSQDEGVNNYHLMYQNLQLRYYETKRSRTGLSATLDYEFNPKHNIYLRGMYNSFVDEETRSRKTYELEDAVNIDNYLYGSVKHDVKFRTKNQQLNTLNLGGENDFDFLKIDYEAAYSNATEETPDRLEAGFENVGQALQVTLDRDGTTFPKPIFKKEGEDSIANDYANYKFDGLNMRESTVDDKNLTAKINFTLPFNPQFMQGKGFLKLGGKIRRKHKYRDVEAKIFSSYDGVWINKIYPTTRPRDVLTLPSISSGVKTTNLLNQNYVIEQIPDPQKMRDFYNYNAFLFYYGDKYDTESRVKSVSEDYDAKELITAYYAMLQYELSNLTIVAGLRSENTEVDYEVKNAIYTGRSYFDTTEVATDSRKHNFLLPNIQIKYSPYNRFNIRAAYSTSFTRPNFEDIIPVSEEDRDEIKYGNSNLEYPFSKNVDIMAEKYLSYDGMLSAGVYYKNIENFVAPYIKHAYDENIISYVDVEVPINGKVANVYGFELQGQFQFNFLESTSLPHFLSDFGIYSNYSFTYSDATMYKRYAANLAADTVDLRNPNGIEAFINKNEEESIVLPGQSKHVANIALYYAGDKLYAKLSANYHDKYLKKLGADADLDEYVDKAWHLDFTASYNITPNVKCFVDIINLLDTPTTTYLGSTDYLKKQEYTSWWGRIGFKFNL